MITYHQFKDYLLTSIKNYLPESLVNIVELELSEDTSIATDIRFQFDGAGPGKCRVIVSEEFGNRMYAKHIFGESLPNVINHLVELIQKGVEEIPIFSDMQKAVTEQRIVFQIVNEKQYQAELVDMPHRSLLDLAVTYQWVFHEDEHSMKRIPITNDLAEWLSLSEEQLFSLALKNSREIYPILVVPMEQVVSGIYEGYGMEQDEIDERMKNSEEFEEEVGMRVVTNEKHLWATFALLYDDVLESIADQMQDDFYIIPSSVHDLIVVKASASDPIFLEELIYSINRDSLNPNEWLSDHLYFYDREKKTISFAIDQSMENQDERVGTAALEVLLLEQEV